MSDRSTRLELSPSTFPNSSKSHYLQTIPPFSNCNPYTTSICSSIESSMNNMQEFKKQEKLFIGGISLNVDLPHLEQLLKQSVQAKGIITIAMVKQIKSNNYSGYGYLSSTCPEDLEKLLNLKTFKYLDSWIGIKPYLTKKNDIKQLKQDKDNRKIHIKGINFRVSEVDLEEYFSKYGTINHIQINKNQSTGSYKGFGFIEFTDESSIKSVTALPVHIIKGVSLYCEKSKTKNIEPQQQIAAEEPNYLPNSYDLNGSYKKNTTRSILAQSKLRYIENNHFSQNIKFNTPSCLQSPSY